FQVAVAPGSSSSKKTVSRTVPWLPAMGQFGAVTSPERRATTAATAPSPALGLLPLVGHAPLASGVPGTDRGNGSPEHDRVGRATDAALPPADDAERDEQWYAEATQPRQASTPDRTVACVNVKPTTSWARGRGLVPALPIIGWTRHRRMMPGRASL